jgi:acetyl esterase/lipase
MMKLRIVVLGLSLIIFSQGKAQVLVDSEFLSSTPAFLLALNPGIPANYDVDFYKLTYNTVDTQGEPTVASGSIALPSNAECSEYPMMVYCHGTVLRQNDVPSAQNLESLLVRLFASSGTISIAPDYLGLGENPGIHPYVHAESQATATIDLIRAANEFLESNELSGNGDVLVTGYSQGGHAAMATLKYAEDNGLNEELGIIAGAPCSGPYDMSGSQTAVLLSDEPYSNPGYLIYVLKSYELAYGNIYNELSDVIQQPYADLVAPYFDGAQDEFGMGVVNELLPGLISELMVDTTLANFESNNNHPLRVALRDNDNYDWTPTVPVLMPYCDGDEQVGFENSLIAETTMNANGAANVSASNVLPGATHGGCFNPAILAAYDFLTSFSQPCGSTLTTTQIARETLKLFPNPTRDFVRVDISGNEGRLVVYDLMGRVVKEVNLNQMSSQIDLTDLKPATYIVAVETEQIIETTTLIILSE